MIKTARQILRERELDIDVMRESEPGSKTRVTAAILDYITAWFESHPTGDKLLLYRLPDSEIPNEKNSEWKRGFLYKVAGNFSFSRGKKNEIPLIVFSKHKSMDPTPFLIALGYQVWTYNGRTYVSLIRKNY